MEEEDTYVSCIGIPVAPVHGGVGLRPGSAGPKYGP